MPNENPVAPLPVASAEAAQGNTVPGPTIRIGDEFGTAKRNLPPVRILLLAVGGVLVIAAAFSFFQRARPQAGGTIVNVTAAQIPAQNAVLVALTFSLRSAAEKPLWIKSIQGKVVMPDGEQTGNALSAMDFDRYYQGFPALKKNIQPPLAPEDKMQPGQEIKRTVIVSFPVDLESFNHRKSLSLIIQAYDQPVPVILNE